MTWLKQPPAFNNQVCHFLGWLLKRDSTEYVFHFLFPGLVTDLFNEHWTFVDGEGHFIHIVGLQHIVIHALFVLHGISDLLEYYKMPIVKGMKYFTACLAFFW